MHRQRGRPRRGLHRAQATREEGAAVLPTDPGSKGNKKERARRYFKLRAPALERLRDSRESFQRLWDGIEFALEKS
jgi:hypothetical protein